MTTSIKVSIIVPVYNIEQYISNCINSLTSQTYTNIEIVLVDDGSSDNSGIICDEFAQKDKRIIVIHKKNEGVAIARLAGFEKSTGDYITFVDGDDFIATDTIEKLLIPVIKHHVDMTCCSYNIQNNEDIYPANYIICGLLNIEQKNKFIATNYLYDDQLGHSSIPIFLVTKLIKKDFVKKGLLAGMGLWWGEDQVASFSILMQISSMYILNECLYYYVRHEGQATQVYKRSLWDNQLCAYKRYEDIDNENLLSQQLRKHVWKYSFMVNLYRKMPLKIKNSSEFIEELKYLEKLDGWKDFFKAPKLGLGWRDEVKFWLIKFKRYELLYILFLKKYYEK